MPTRPPGRKIGQYRHSPGNEMAPGPDGVLRPTRVRRRFPFRGFIPMGYGVLGALTCAGVSLALRRTGNGRLVPRHEVDAAVPPAPSMDNVLFGAGLPEVVLSAALVGYWLWSSLWKMRVSATLQGRGIRGVLPPLLGRALLLGPLMALAALPIGAFGFCIRAMPANIPWFMRPLFGLPGMLTFSLSALATGTIPLVLILLGLLVGLVTAVLVAVLWPYFPEEALLK